MSRHVTRLVVVLAALALVLPAQAAAKKRRHHGVPPAAASTDRQRPALPEATPAPRQRPDLQSPLPEAAPVAREPQSLPETMPAPHPRPAVEAAQPEPRPSDAAEEVPDTGKAADPYGRNRLRSVGRHNWKDFENGASDAERQADAACRARLRQLGVAFEPQAPISDPAGCRVPFPLSVSKLSPDIALEPPGVMNCAMTEAAARFAQAVIAPAAQSAYGAALKSIANASAYVCRPRNGTAKLSEHAFGNALDMARFVLADGKAVDVKETADPRDAAFLATIRKAACGPFKTVLGPGSDADHAFHFHVDLAPRRNGGTFCQ